MNEIRVKVLITSGKKKERKEGNEKRESKEGNEKKERKEKTYRKERQERKLKAEKKENKNRRRVNKSELMIYIIVLDQCKQSN